MKTKAPQTLSNASCPTCGHGYRRKRKTQRACSRPCYLALWHFEEITKALLTGQANGLFGAIRELAKVKR